MEYVTLGRIIDAFSLDGTLKVLSSTSHPEKRYQKGNKIILVSPKNEQTELTVVSFRSNKGIDFVKVEEITFKEAALERKGYLLQAPKDESVLDKGEYYFSDLEKCTVYDEEGRLLGKVKKVEEFPSAITLRVMRNNLKDFFVPFVKEFIKEVDIKEAKIIIHVIEGML